MFSACKFGTPWWWLVKAETYVGAIDSVYENTVHMLGFNLVMWRSQKCCAFGKERRQVETSLLQPCAYFLSVEHDKPTSYGKHFNAAVQMSKCHSKVLCNFVAFTERLWAKDCNSKNKKGNSSFIYYFRSWGMWRCVVGWVFLDVSKDNGAIIFECEAVWLDWHSITYHKKSVLIRPAVEISN
jgi:hypothetical protein